jgi:hypothetical protein
MLIPQHTVPARQVIPDNATLRHNDEESVIQMYLKCALGHMSYSVSTHTETEREREKNDEGFLSDCIHRDRERVRVAEAHCTVVTGAQEVRRCDACLPACRHHEAGPQGGGGC